MAVIKAYTTEARIETFLGISITTGQADDAINAAVAIIDDMTGRNFIADSTATARVYSGDGSQYLPIDDCVAITLVELGNDAYGDAHTTIASTGLNRYIVNPANSLPVRGLHLRSQAWTPGLFDHRITAKWGYSVACPEDVAFAATIIAAGIYNANRGKGTGSNIKSESIGNYSVSYTNEEGWTELKRAMQILQTRKKIRL